MHSHETFQAQQSSSIKVSSRNICYRQLSNKIIRLNHSVAYLQVKQKYEFINLDTLKNAY